VCSFKTAYHLKILNFETAEGAIYTAKILARSDLDRQIVRSPTCEIVIPEVELTLPATKRGQLTTVEGLIRDVVSDLSMDQPLRRIQDEEGYKTIEGILEKLRAILGDEPDEDEDEEKKAEKKEEKDKEGPITPFTVRLDDPAGNSWIEFIGSMADPKWNMRKYHRTLEHNVALGLVAPPEEQAQAEEEEEAPAATTEGGAVPDDEVLVFPGNCSSCGHPIDTKMKKVAIPYFKVRWLSA
jgi:zinc finger protein